MNHWNYEYDQWGYWYEYTLPEYPKTNGVRDGEVVVYLKDIRDAYAQASRQDLGLYLDVENFHPYGLYVPADDVIFPIYVFNGGNYADSHDKLNLIFQVADNTATGSIARSAEILMENGSSTTRLTVIQDGVTSIRLKASGTSVMGNQTGVQLTVYSDDNWTLSTTGGQLTFADNYDPKTTPLSAGNTGSFGRPVTLILPINYTETDNLYTVTATNNTTYDSVSIDITHRKATLTNENVMFSADTDFYSTSTETIALKNFTVYYTRASWN